MAVTQNKRTGEGLAYKFLCGWSLLRSIVSEIPLYMIVIVVAFTVVGATEWQQSCKRQK